MSFTDVLLKDGLLDCPKLLVKSYDVTAAMLVFQNKVMAAMMVYQTNPLGSELYFYANTFFLFFQ